VTSVRGAIACQAACTAIAAWLCGVAHAQQAATAQPASGRPSAALFATAGAVPGDEALDAALQAGLDKLGVVRVTVRPGLDLEAVQLAIDCVAQTVACLHAVAAESGVQILIAPALVRSDAELVLTLLRFDARESGSVPVRVEHKQPGTRLTPELLDALPDLLRELFGLSQAVGPVEAPPSAALSDVEAAETSRLATPAHSEPALLGPLVVGGVGVLLVGGGVAAGLMMQATHDEYLKLPLNSEQQVDQAIDTRSRGETQAMVANVLYGVGAAAIVAGAIWFAIELGDAHEGRAQTALLPALGPGQLGVTLLQRGPSL
jgi:hypothetical protein